MGLFRSSDRDRYHHNSGSFHLSGSLQRRFLEAHRQASLAAREVIHVSCYLHQNPLKSGAPIVRNLPQATHSKRLLAFR